MKIIRLFLADDSALLVEAVCEFLQGYKKLEIVGTSSTAQEALRRAQTLQPEIVLVDFGLPDLSGVKAIRALRALLPRTAIVVWSMYDSAIHRRAVKEAGADGFGNKARIVEDLVEAIERAVRAQES